MALERSTEVETIHLVPAETNLIALGAGAKDIRRDAQGLVNIVDSIKNGDLAENTETLKLIQDRLDGISLTIRALQRRYAAQRDRR